MKKNNTNNFYKSILNDYNASFIISIDSFIENILNLRDSFNNHYPKVEIGYSYKTNYIPSICKAAHNVGCWAEVVSDFELEMALMNQDASEKRIIYNGPIKTSSSIIRTFENNGICNIDNLDELNLIKHIIETENIKNAQIALRINSTFNDNDSRFGMDEEDIEKAIQIISNLNHVDLVGFHLHLPFRNMDSFKYRVDVLKKIYLKYKNLKPSYLNIGGGFFGVLSPKMKEILGIDLPPTFEKYAEVIGKELNRFFKENNLSHPTLYIEPGSCVVANALTFISKVKSIKEIDFQKIIVTYAARHLLCPTNKTMDLPISILSLSDDPFNLKNHNEFHYNVVGFTCIESDRLGSIRCQKLRNTDNLCIEISNVGSYSIVMGSDFILPQPPIFEIKNGMLSLCREQKTVNDVYGTFSQ